MKKITFFYLIPVALLVRKNIVVQQPTPTISDAEAIQKQQQNGSWYDVNYADSAISIWGPIWIF